MAKNTNDLIKGGIEISSQLMIFNQLHEAINNPKISFSDIAGIINKDSSLSLRLLKIANSSFYSFPRKIETITQAITVIGTNQLRDMVLATTVMKSFNGISNSLINMDLFWRHSIVCGLASRIIATYKHKPNVDRFYVSGLMHDIGRLILCMKFPKQVNKALNLSQTKDKLLHAAERDVTGYDHAAIGGALLHAWKLPESLEEAVAFHHSPSSATRYPFEAAVVHLADIIANALQIGSSGELFVQPLDTSAWEVVDLPASIMSAIINQIERQFADAVEIFLI